MAGLRSATSFSSTRIRPSARVEHASQIALTHQQLPNGQCSFRDLTLGNSSQTCGCRRFWLNNNTAKTPHTASGSASFESAWCFCGHHACYHDFVQDDSCIPGDTLSHSHNRPHRVSQLQPGPNTHSKFQPSSAAHRYEQHAPGLGLFFDRDAHSRPPGLQVPQADTTRASTPSLPLTQYNSKVASQQQSTPIDARHRQSPSTDFVKYIESQRRSAPTIETALQHPAEAKEDCLQSATEAATPSLCGTPALRNADDEFDKVRDCIDSLADPESTGPPERVQSDAAISQRLVSHIQALRHILSSRPGLMSSIADLDKRMDALENVSFAHGSVDDLHDRFEHFDARLLEIESKVDELERQRTASDSCEPTAAVHARTVAESFDSEMTDCDSHRSSRRHRLNQSERLQQLEQRLADLEDTSLPTTLRPWQVEVVLLPWGHDLKGIWSVESDGLHTQGSDALDLSTQTGARLPVPQSYGTFNNYSQPPSHATSSDNATLDWPGTAKTLMWARACGATSGTGGRIYQRLNSRGFVRSVTISSNDARKLHNIILDAFGDLLECNGQYSVSQTSCSISRQHPTLFALQSPYIPLRKIHKTSRLRFLSIPELSNPLLWSSEFLDCDIFMKAPAAGIRRLFITTPAAYTQSIKHRGWTWQMIRELPRTGNTSSANNEAEVLEADANEPCWMFDSKLDTLSTSVHSSFASKDSFQKQPSFASSHPLSPGKTEWSSDSNAEDEQDVTISRPGHDYAPSRIALGPITPVSELPPTQMRRTVSLPMSTQSDMLSRLPPRREILSFDQASGKCSTKRPRASLDSDDSVPAVRGRWALTPRQSREPHSPSANNGLSGLVEPLAANSTRVKRGPTPSAYATPFSNSFAPISSLGNSWQGGDTDVDTSSSDNDSGNDMVENENGNEFATADVVDAAFDRAVTMEEDAWEGVGGDGFEDEIHNAAPAEVYVRHREDYDDADNESEYDSDDDNEEEGEPFMDESQ